MTMLLLQDSTDPSKPFEEAIQNSADALARVVDDLPNVEINIKIRN